jgi:hypothetical protein
VLDHHLGGRDISEELAMFRVRRSAAVAPRSHVVRGPVIVDL